MSDRQPDRSTNPLLEARLRRNFRPTRLSARQRAHHLQRLDQWEDDDLRYLQQRSLAELGILAAALVAVLAIAAWLAWPNDDADEPTQLEMAQATLTARADHTAADTEPSTSVEAAGVAPRPTFSGVCEVSEPQDRDPQATDNSGGVNTWYGDERLWMGPVPPVAASEPLDAEEQTEMAQGSWYAGSPMRTVWVGSPEPVAITGVQVDGDAILEIVATRLQSLDEYETTILFPEPGCWQITGSTADAVLSVTVEVAPIAERPDYVAAQQDRESGLPWPQPTACNAIGWVVDDRATQRAAQWWTESGELALGDDDGILFEGENNVTWLTGVFTERGYDFVVEAELDDDQVERFQLSVNSQQPIFEGRLEFPSPGCWELHVEHPTPDAGPSTTIFTVYVYPAECRPDIQAMEIPSTCRAPESS